MICTKKHDSFWYNKGPTNGIEWLEHNLERLEWQELVRKGDKDGIKKSFVFYVTRTSDFVVIVYLLPVSDSVFKFSYQELSQIIMGKMSVVYSLTNLI